MSVRNVVQRGYGAGATIPFIVTRGYTIGPSGIASAAVGGVTAFTEPTVVADGQVTTITLTADTWVPSGAAFNQVRQIILNGFTAVQSEVTGWNKEVRDKQPVTSVVRTSDNLVTITWSAAPDYDITVSETITVTVPDEALITSPTPLVATPTIGVTATAALLRSHIVRFTSISRSAAFASTSRSATFQSVSNATVKITNTPQPLGFILTEDGGILLQENDLPIALE